MHNLMITREEITQVETRLWAAQRLSDVNELDQLLHDELVAVVPTGQIMTKEMDLSAHRAKMMVIEDAFTEIDEIRIMDDTALTVVTMTAKGKMMGKPLNGKFKYLRVWKRFDHSLKVVGASIMLLPDDAREREKK